MVQATSTFQTCFAKLDTFVNTNGRESVGVVRLSQMYMYMWVGGLLE